MISVEFSLFNRMTCQEDRLLQGTEELLIGQGVLDGVKIELSAGPHDQLGLVPRTDGDGQSHKVAAVIKGTPGTVIPGEKQERVRLVEKIRGIEEGWLFIIDIFLGGDNSQFLIEHLDLAVQVLQGHDNGLKHSSPVVGVKHACLRGTDLNLTFLGQPNLPPRIRLIIVSQFIGRTGRERHHSSEQHRQQPS